MSALPKAAARSSRSSVNGIGDLMVVEDWERAEALVRSGHDSSLVVVAAAAEAASATQRAQAGLTARRGPLPLRAYASGFRCLVVMPTYNERDNLEPLLRDVLAYLETDVLVIDDGSPDGTGALADQLAAATPHIKVLHRERKLGLGTAYLRGFAWAIEHGYQRVFEMDADFSHPPWDLPRLAAASANADLVIGSRYVPGGSTIGWSLRRRLLSRGANAYARLCLGLRVRDATAGFRCYNVDKLKQLPLHEVRAEGYAFQVEMAYRMARAGVRIAEVPIHFIDRTIGQSKMDARVAREAIWLVPALRWRLRRSKA